MKTEARGAFIVESFLSDDASNHAKAVKYLTDQVFGAIMKTTRNRDKALDIFQDLLEEVWLKVRAKKLVYQGEGPFFRYVHTTWRRFWWIKYCQEGESLSESEFGEMAEESSAERDGQREKLFLHYFNQLDPLCQYLIRARSNGGSWKDIEEEVNAELPPNKRYSNDAIRMKYSRAMRKLKNSIAKQSEPKRFKHGHIHKLI